VSVYTLGKLVAYSEIILGRFIC